MERRQAALPEQTEKGVIMLPGPGTQGLLASARLRLPVLFALHGSEVSLKFPANRSG